MFSISFVFRAIHLSSFGGLKRAPSNVRGSGDQSISVERLLPAVASDRSAGLFMYVEARSTLSDQDT